MKRYSLLTLFLLTISLTVSAAVTFTDKPNYPNLVFTVLDEEAKTVSVKAESIAYYTQDSILNIPASVTNSGDTYTVTTIAADGFKAIKIKQIILPSTIKTIESQAFRDIVSSFTIELNEGLEEIGNRAFCRSTGMIGTLTLPSTLQTIYSSAVFFDIRVDRIIINTSVPPSLTDESQYRIPSSVYINVPCFTYDTYASAAGWDIYKEKLIDPCKQIFTVDGIKYSTTSETTVSIVGYENDFVFGETLEIVPQVTHNKVTYQVSTIGESAFANTPIKSLVLPNTIVNIGYKAFYGCTALTSINLNEGLEVIGERAFTQSPLCDTICIPKTVKAIGSAAFYCANNQKLRAVKMLPTTAPSLVGFQSEYPVFYPISIKVLIPERSYFSYHTEPNWETWTIIDPYIHIQDNLRFTFASLTEAKLLGFYQTPKKENPATLVIPSTIRITDSEGSEHVLSVTQMADSCFRGTYISSVEIPATILRISKAAFRDISTLTTITLNEGLKGIGERAFTKDSLLTGNIVIPSTVDTIGPAAFHSCVGVEKYTLMCMQPPITPRYNSSDLTFASSKAVFVVPCLQSPSYLTADYWSTLNIQDECSQIEREGILYKVNINNKELNVVSYNPEVVDSNVIIPSQITIIEGETYDVSSIADRAFDKSTVIQSLTLPNSDKFKSLGKSAFRECTNLVKIDLGNGLQAIADSCFYKGVFTSIAMPATLQTIGNYAFRDNKAMTTITLNEGLKTIGERSFTNNSNLTETLIIPSTVTQVKAAAFTGCNKLSNIILRGTTPPQVNADTYPVFGSASSFIVPCGSTEAYKTEENYWKDLSSKIKNDCKPLILSQGDILERDTAVSSIAYSRTFDMDVWQTLYLPFEVDSVLVYDDEDEKYYDINYPFVPGYGGYFYLNEYDNANVEEATITFTTATTMEGNTPYLIQFPTTDGYFVGKDIVFKSKAGEYTLKKSDYSQPEATTQFQVSGNSSVYNQSVSDMYIFRATLVTGKNGTPLQTVDGKDSIKYEFNQQASATLKPFEFGLLPYVVEPSSGISSAPMRMSLRIGRSSGNTGGGDITTSVSETHAPNAITYRTGVGELALSLNGLPCELYSVSGTLLFSSAGGTEEITIPLEKGIYILYSEGKSQKIVL